MAQETLIFDGTNPEKERAFQQQVVKTETFQQELIEVTQHERKKYNNLKIAGGVLAAGGAALAFMSFMPAPEHVEEATKDQPIPLPENPEKATTVNDNMSFGEAFETARHEHGAGAYFVWHGNTYGTYYKTEWDKLTPEEQKEFYQNVVHENGNHPESLNEHIAEPVIIHDHAPESMYVNDDMSFKDAFAIARNEVGSGGVFEWHGKTYSTYTHDEWQNMDHSEHMAFNHSTEHLHLNGGEVQHDHQGTLASDYIYHTPSPDIPDTSDTGEHFLGEQLMDVGNGQQVTVGLFEHNGVQEIRIDADNNGSYEYVYNPENGQVTSLQTGEVVTDQSTNQPDHLADNTDTPLSSQEVMIDGHHAWVTTFADGRVEANVDIDGDGTPDSLVKIDQSGHMQLYDSSNHLVHEEQLDINSGEQYNNPSNPNLGEDPTLDPNVHNQDTGHFTMDSTDGEDQNHLANLDGNHDDSVYKADDYQLQDTSHDNSDYQIASNDFDYNNDDMNHLHDPSFDNNASMDDWG